MALNTQQRLVVENLLLQREALYARVYAIEQQINALLGDEYPFPEPPEPVAVGAPKAQKAKKKAKATTPAAPKLRPLEGPETAYRVQFQQASTQPPEVHVDRKSLQALLQSDTGLSMIAAIETLDAEGETVERIYEKEA